MKWIFDLDFTLYSNFDVNEKNKKTFYNSITKKPLLNELLNKLQGDKYIFSNGTESHVIEVIKKMRIKTMFKDIAYVEEFDKPKPSNSAYKYVINKFKINSNDTIYFFEDNIDNLKTAKNFGWVTILLSLKNKKYKYADYVFPNIETALYYFINKNM